MDLNTPLLLLNPFAVEVIENAHKQASIVKSLNSKDVSKLRDFVADTPKVERSPLLLWFLSEVEKLGWRDVERFFQDVGLGNVTALGRALPLARATRVNAGPAIVTATAAGFKQFEMSVPVEAGKETQLKIVLEPIQLPLAPGAVADTTLAPASSLPGTDLHAHSWRTWTGGTLLGVGGAAAAWGIVWIALDGHSASGSCTAGAPAGCSPGLHLVQIRLSLAKALSLILVTTAGYGPDAHDFAKDKPIELIDGGDLLYLLDQQGIRARIVMPA